MNITIENVEFYLLILVRISAFIFTAPIFSINSIPRKVKAAISVFLTIVVSNIISIQSLSYQTVYGFAGLIIQEFMVGLLIGFFCSISIKIITLSGQLLDTEIGFAMASVFDPVNNTQVTITGNLLNYSVLLIMLVTNLHYYLIKAIVSTFKVVPIGKAIFSFDLYEIMVKFMMDFFIIGFRIILPIFASILIVNLVLAVLARISPQMNMFVVGFQIKILVGLLMLSVLIALLPSISNFLTDEIKTMLNLILSSLAGS